MFTFFQNYLAYLETCLKIDVSYESTFSYIRNLDLSKITVYEYEEVQLQVLSRDAH